jgi:hypothetical protein
MSSQGMGQGGSRGLPIGERLWNVVREVLADHPVTLPQGGSQPVEFTPSGEDLMRGFIADGVEKLRARGTQEPEIITAEDNIRKFTDYMAGDAESQGAYEIDEIIFNQAKRWWCPQGLWPFC